MAAELSDSEIDALVEQAGARAKEGDQGLALAAAEPLVQRQAREPNAARALLRLVGRQTFAVDRAVDLVRGVVDAHIDDDELAARAGSALEGAHDIRYLNGGPPSDPLFARIAHHLRERAAALRGTPSEARVLRGLATSARLLGRAWDADAEGAYRGLVDLAPTDWAEHYDLGLFFKVRGRFAEGAAANRRAAELGGADDDSVRWNLGICATGARDGATALAVWKQYGHRIELGRFGLPEGPYGQVKVRLAEHPLAERSADENDPGREETIWIERLSPCHGIVRSALYQDFGVDFGDVVLFDGAPITHHTYGDHRIPVFPHLVTLERGGYRILRFAGTQPKKGAIEALSEHLPGGCVLYPHTEKFVILCRHCWSDEKLDHLQHGQEEHHVVRGKLCAPPSVGAAELRRALDAAVTQASVRVFVPELSELLGDHARADVEARRMAMLDGG
jgi:hypothetical protein